MGAIAIISPIHSVGRVQRFEQKQLSMARETWG